eukprot:scaffold106501_cov30-Tisochrysis_lutea.AAC.3
MQSVQGLGRKERVEDAQTFWVTSRCGKVALRHFRSKVDGAAQVEAYCMRVFVRWHAVHGSEKGAFQSRTLRCDAPETTLNGRAEFHACCDEPGRSLRPTAVLATRDVSIGKAPPVPVSKAPLQVTGARVWHTTTDSSNVSIAFSSACAVLLSIATMSKTMCSSRRHRGCRASIRLPINQVSSSLVSIAREQMQEFSLRWTYSIATASPRSTRSTSVVELDEYRKASSCALRFKSFAIRATVGKIHSYLTARSSRLRLRQRGPGGGVQRRKLKPRFYCRVAATRLDGAEARVNLIRVMAQNCGMCAEPHARRFEEEILVEAAQRAIVELLVRCKRIAEIIRGMQSPSMQLERECISRQINEQRLLLCLEVVHKFYVRLEFANRVHTRVIYQV